MLWNKKIEQSSETFGELGTWTSYKNSKIFAEKLFFIRDVKELFSFVKERNELEQFVSSLKFQEALAISNEVLQKSLGTKHKKIKKIASSQPIFLSIGLR